MKSIRVERLDWKKLKIEILFDENKNFILDNIFP